MKKVFCMIALSILCSIEGFTESQPNVRNSFFPVLKDGSPSAFVTFSRPKQTHGLAMKNPKGVQYETEDYLGRRGVKPSENSPEKYFYFQTAEDQLVSATGTFFVTVAYLDKGQGALTLDYMYLDGEGNTQLRSDRVFLGDSGIWRQHSFTLAGASLDHSLDGETDFRIYCPDILIHAVMLTRMPIVPQTPAAGALFRQASVSPPPGCEFAVVLTNEETGSMWDHENLFAEKIQLYKAWGVSYVIEDLFVKRSPGSSGGLDFSLYAKRKDKLAEAGLVWTPRLRIGDLDALPLNLTMPLQKAVGTDRPEEGPMLSMWDSRVVDLYAQVFDQMRMSINSNQTSRFILSFAGDWGPLFFSLESSQNRGWPDFWAGDPFAQSDFIRYLQKRYGNHRAVRAAWGDDVRSFNAIVPSISSDFSPRRNLDAYTWYRESMAIFISRILERAKLYFPQTHFIIEIAEDFEFSALDPSLIASLAARSGSSVVMIVRTPLASASPIWGCLANTCQRKGVSFGLRCIGRGGGDEMLSALYSLASDGGALFYFSEQFMVGEKSWSSYVNSISQVQRRRSHSRMALIFPRT
ncbi:MAG: hypothetical protein ACP5I1_12135, partial [Candidatus Hinthialibacter sp.]